MSEKITISMGEGKVGKGDVILESTGIGSCVVICLYNKQQKAGGLVHIMLPTDKHLTKANPWRFADQGIKQLIALLSKTYKINATNLQAKIVGGASMFASLSMDLGKENVTKTKSILSKEHIPLVAEETGGSHGRSVWFSLTDGRVVVSKTHGATKEI